MAATRRAAPRQRTATYRFQLDGRFGFDAAAEVVDYVGRLGVSHVYLSPCLQAAEGSAHGYDVVDPTRIDTARGGEAAFERLLRRCQDAGLRVMLDIVPNHLAASEQGPWWRDVLANGVESRYAHHFDIDWNSPDPGLRGKVLLPILGAPLDEEIAAGRLRVVVEDGVPQLAAYDRRLPLAPGTAPDAPATADVAAVIAAQHYVPEFWRDGLKRLNWRRFFDVTSLVGVRVEDPTVFDDTHRKVLEYVAAGLVHGLRVDHPDGLRDPAGYFRRLRAAAPGAWILIEKILETDERLPDAWPVDGTTGYDFMNRATALFVAREAEAPLTELCTDLVGTCPPFEDLQRDKRRDVIRDLFEPELRGLSALLEATAAEDGTRVDTAAARDALVAVLVHFPVYRTYVPADGVADARDRRHLATAFAAARAATAPPQAPDVPVALDVLERALLGDLRSEPARELRARFQQFSGPVIAKGVEDTALYCDRRMSALAEVGADPGRFGITVDAFHAFCERLADAWPESMLSTSTHDTKRSEDVRLRIAALSEFDGEWADAVRTWREHNERHRVDDMPDRGTEYLLYQTLVGVWPASVERIATTMLKSAREAKEHTSWIDGEPAFERALERFVGAILDDAAFVGQLETFVARIRPVARIHSLSQTLLKLTAPGVPDIYQGCEHWRETLVDPDNRRHVDFGRLARLLDTADAAGPEAAFADPDGGLAKLWLTARALAVRSAHPSAFGPTAGYRRLPVDAAGAEHTIAFARDETVVTIAPRLVHRRPAAALEARVELPEGVWVDALTGGPLDTGEPTVGRLFERFPFALLRRENPLG